MNGKIKWLIKKTIEREIRSIGKDIGKGNDKEKRMWDDVRENWDQKGRAKMVVFYFKGN